MKYRIVEVSPPGVGDVYYEVEEQIDIPDALMKHWRFVAKFNTIEACDRYIQNRAQPTRKVISEIEV